VYKKLNTPGPILCIIGVLVPVVGVVMQMTILYLLALLFIGIGVFLINKKKKDLQKSLEILKPKLVKSQNELNETNFRIEELQKELFSRVDKFPEVIQIRGAFQQTAKNILGKNILLDESGVFPKTTLVTLDLSSAQSNLDSIVSKINEIKTVPVLLSPNINQDLEDPINSLYGEEVVLQDLVDQFTDNLTKIEDIKIELPLVEKNNFLSQNYQQGNLFLKFRK
jgi:hypothetical protein